MACARLILASGSPTCSTACAAATATSSARLSAIPTSSDAWTISRRAMKRGSSPASTILANQNNAASASEPRIDLMNALITS